MLERIGVVGEDKSGQGEGLLGGEDYAAGLGKVTAHFVDLVHDTMTQFWEQDLDMIGIDDGRHNAGRGRSGACVER